MSTERRDSHDGGLGLPGGRRRYGDALLSAGLLDRASLRNAAAHADLSGLSLPDAAVALGLVPEADAYALLAVTAGVALVDLQEIAPSKLARRLIPEALARKHSIIPLFEDNRTLTYASAKPFDSDADRDVAFVSGRQPRAVLACRSQILKALDSYRLSGEGLERSLERVRDDRTVRSEAVPAASLDEADSSIVDLCSQIVRGAIEAHASDIHLEAFPDRGVVRYRVHGILGQAATIPADAVPHVVNRFKVMARADIAVRSQPQDGAFRVNVARSTVDVRLSTLPTVHGEKVVMRLIDGTSPLRAIDALGYDQATVDRLRRALRRPDGLVLFTGPTASGKSTALYASLNELRTGRTNIVTVEDPVERYVEGINQTAVNVRAGNTFAAVLRSVLRQDPNIIMVGEIRDSEVAQIVGQAAYTGHLVLSSLHTTDAASAVSRLQNLGLEPFRIAESLAAVFAQRLVRRLCPDCREMLGDVEAVRAGAAHGIPRVQARAGAGCERCKQTGYVDRMPVAEVLSPTEELRAAIRDGANERAVRAAMRAAGVRTMREVALGLVAEGVTSLEEINRVLADEDMPVPAPPSRVQPRILVVDDDRLIRQMARRVLEKEAYEVIEGSDGEQALALVERERPDLLLIDLMMPGMDGYTAIERVRMRSHLESLPVMVLTSETGDGVEERVLEAGADDYLVKPIEPGILLSRIRAVFRRTARQAA